MTSHDRFFLIQDDTSGTKFIQHAFELTAIPIASSPLNELNLEQRSADITICSSTTFEKFKDAILKSTKQGLLIVDENINDKSFDLKIPYQMLNIPCTIYDFKHAFDALIRKEYCVPKTSVDTFLNHNLVGESKAIHKIKKMIKRVSKSDSNVLILGQSGTGKEVIASCIHHLSDRCKKPFVPINCGAIPAELMESELFGHEKGAFTGAISKRAGRFELANHGTLFLDEIGDMPLAMQVKLLRVLQEQKIDRVGSTNSLEVDVRLVAATHKNLEDMIKENTFREDLYFRLNVIPIYVPTLQERAEDIPLLVKQHLDRIRKRIPHEAIFDDQALQAMSQYSWPGNIRELANFIERMVVLCDDEVIGEEKVKEQMQLLHNKKPTLHIPEDLNTKNLKAYLEQLESQLKSFVEDPDHPLPTL